MATRALQQLLTSGRARLMINRCSYFSTSSVGLKRHKDVKDEDVYRERYAKRQAYERKEKLTRQHAAQDQRQKLLKQVDHAASQVESYGNQDLKEIEQIWSELHKDQPCFQTIISAAEYEYIHQRGQLFPQFAYPVPRKYRYDFYQQHFNGHDVYFTPQLQYQLYKEEALTAMILRHFIQYKDSKGIVLVSGSLDSQLMTPQDARLLYQQLHHYYGPMSGMRFHSVRQFQLEPLVFRGEIDKAKVTPIVINSKSVSNAFLIRELEALLDESSDNFQTSTS